MGLDGLELMMKVEDAFDIKISIDELTTVGNLHTHILRRLNLEDVPSLIPMGDGCPSIATFIAIRKAVTSLLLINRNAVRPKTALADIIPIQSRRQVWQQLRSLTHLPLPSLESAESTDPIFWLYTGLLAGILIVCGMIYGGLGLLIGTSFAIPIILWLLTVTKRIEAVFPLNYSTIADVVHYAKPQSHQVSEDPPRVILDRNAIWDQLVRIIADVLGVAPL